MSTSDEIVIRLCRLPIELRQRGDVSPIGIVSEIGTETCRKNNKFELLLTYLRDNPELIDAWDMHSADQRISSGWYFSAEDKVVGYSPNGEHEVQHFATSAEACARFVELMLSRILESVAQGD